MRRKYWVVYRDDGTDDGVGTPVSENIFSFRRAEELADSLNEIGDYSYFVVEHEEDDY